MQAGQNVETGFQIVLRDHDQVLESQMWQTAIEGSDGAPVILQHVDFKTQNQAPFRVRERLAAYPQGDGLRFLGKPALPHDLTIRADDGRRAGDRPARAQA